MSNAFRGLTVSLQWRDLTSFLDDVKCSNSDVPHHWNTSLKCLRGMLGILSRGQVKNFCNYV